MINTMEFNIIHNKLMSLISSLISLITPAIDTNIKKLNPIEVNCKANR